jgi:arylsulfatase A-like enzyme
VIGAARCAVPAALAILLACGPTTRSAPPDGGPLLEEGQSATIGRETRLALRLQPTAKDPAGRHFTLMLPAAASLDVGYGVPNASIAAAAAPARFEIRLKAPDHSVHVLLSRKLDPGTPEHRRWFDARVDLSRWSGDRVRLEFRVAAEPGDGPPAQGAFADPWIRGAPHEVARPNVMLVSIDTLRARNVGAYGYARDTTPFLDEWAAEGALFENAITTSVTTGPSHMSLFTGLYPVNHGMRTGLGSKLPGNVTAAAAFGAAGYHTAAFTENGYIIRERGFGEGFAEYTENPGEKRRAPGQVRLTFGQARRWLELRARRPFFLFVHTYQVHAPFRPPDEYAALFEADGAPGPSDEAWARRMRDAYDREIRFVDDQLRTLVAALGEAAERTLVAVVSDHGEEFAEHGLYQHGGAVYEETLRVPMIFRGPGVPAGRHAAPVSLVDVTPTLLELAALPVPAQLDGMSLAPLLRGEAAPPARTLFAEARATRRWRGPRRGEAWNPPLVAVRGPHGKFIVHRPDEGEARATLHFDLERDAGERAPRQVQGEELRRVNALVDDYLEGRVDPSLLREPDDPSALDPDLRERLRQLGYLE